MEGFASGSVPKIPAMASPHRNRHIGVHDTNPGSRVFTNRNLEQMMNKSELIQSLSERIKISNDEASTIVDSFFDSMRDALLRGDRIEIRGFGSFKIKQYEGYVGRNPKTGESVQVKPKKMPFFKAGKGLLDYLNG